MTTTILIAMAADEDHADLQRTTAALLNARASSLCIDHHAAEIRTRTDAEITDDENLPHGVESLAFRVLDSHSARQRHLIPGYNYLHRNGQTAQILGFSVKLRGLEILNDAMNQALAALHDTRRFAVEGEDEPFTYASMLAANAEDASFLAWMKDAPVGAQWLDGNQTRRVA